MAFRFNLDAVLRLRESLEQAELSKLQLIAGAAASKRAEVESVEMDLKTAQLLTFQTVVASGITGAELHFEIEREAALNTLRSRLLQELSILEQKRRDQHSRYIHARMQREILSNLFKRKFAEYEIDESRRSQRRLDELFLMRSVSSTRK